MKDLDRPEEAPTPALPRRAGGGRRKHSRLAAARTALRADLAWLRGFPATDGHRTPGGLAWVVVPSLEAQRPVERVVVDRGRLSVTARAASAALRRFPSALRDLVGDPAAWAAQVRALVGLLAGAVDAGAPPPRDALLSAFEPAVARALARLAPAVFARSSPEPAIAPLLRALAWVHAAEPGRLPLAVEVALARAGAFATLLARVPGDDGLALAARIVDQTLDEADPLGEIVELAGDERAWTVRIERCDDPLAHAAKLLEQRRRVAPQPLPARLVPPPGRLGNDLAKLLGELLVERPARRAELAALICPMLPRADFEARARWWEEARVAVEDARRLLARPALAVPEDLAPLRERIRVLALREGSWWNFARSLEVVRRVVERAAPGLQELTVRALLALPEDLAHDRPRRDLLCAVDQMSGRSPEQASRVVRLASRLVGEVRARAVELVDAPARCSWIARLAVDLLDDLRSGGEPATLVRDRLEDVERAARALVLAQGWGRRGPFANPGAWASALACVDAGMTPSAAIEVARSLDGVPAGEHPAHAHVRIAARLCAGEKKDVAAIASALQRGGDPGGWRGLEDVIATTGGPEVVRAGLLAGEVTLVRAIAERASLLRAVGDPLTPRAATAPTTGAAGAAARLPDDVERVLERCPELAAAARRLAALPGGERGVVRAVRRLAPTREAIEVELTTLTALATRAGRVEGEGEIEREDPGPEVRNREPGTGSREPEGRGNRQQATGDRQ